VLDGPFSDRFTVSRLLFETTPPPPRVHAFVYGWDGELITLGIRAGFYDASGKLLGMAEQNVNQRNSDPNAIVPTQLTFDLVAADDLPGTSFALITVFDFVTE
jgi:hypothetical protein